MPSTAGYTTILLGCPIWNVRPPRLMGTILEAVALTGVTIVPFTTHATSGSGAVEEEYAAWCPGRPSAAGSPCVVNRPQDPGPPCRPGSAGMAW